MSDRVPPFAWDDEQPVRLTALRPLERVGNPYYGPIAHKSERALPIGEFLDKFSGEWIRCTMREYLDAIGWDR